MTNYYKTDFSSLTDEEVIQGLSLLEKLEYCIDINEPNVVELWGVFLSMRQRLIGEKYDRENAKWAKKTERRKKRKEGVAVSLPKKRIAKHVRSVRKI